MNEQWNHLPDKKSSKPSFSEKEDVKVGQKIFTSLQVSPFGTSV